MASVSVGLWVGVGGRYEPVELNGVSHFIEHMLFKGTHKRSAKDISQAVEGIGGYLNAFTGEENTCFFSRARHDRLDELLEVLADMFLNSKFTRSKSKRNATLSRRSWRCISTNHRTTSRNCSTPHFGPTSRWAGR